MSKKLYSNCLVLVSSRNGFERDLHKQKNACFTNKQTFDSLHGHALKRIYKLKLYLLSVLNKFPCITVSHKLDLFDKLITPIHGYCSEVWGYWEAAQLETVHLQYMEQLVGVRTQTQNNSVYGELGWFPLQINRSICVIRYWLNIIALDNGKCSKIVYDQMLNDQMMYPNVNNWTSHVKRILEH